LVAVFDCWTQEHQIDSNLSPYIDKELLKKNHLCVNGTAIVKEKGFNYLHPKVLSHLSLNA
jgi:hypothetical protein